MTTYKLEETPDVFVSPYNNDTIRYQMISFNEWPKYKIIRDIYLNFDQLIIYGIEIKEPILQKLYNSLRLRVDGTRLRDDGTIFVNCNGECYIWVLSKGFFRPLNNVIFDWSPFGVIVPNSVNDILRKEVQQKDQELMVMSTNKDSLLEASKKEIEELSTCLKDREVELQKASNELSSKKSELESLNSMFQSTKIELESSNKSIKEVECQLESSLKKTIELGEQLSRCVKESEEKEAKLIEVQDQLSMTKKDQLQSMKILFEFTEAAKEVGDQCSDESYVNKAVEIVDE